MTQFEKTVKTIAIVVAVFVIVVIIGGIVTAIVAVSSVCSSDKAQEMFKEGTNKAVEHAASQLKDVDQYFDDSDVDDLEVCNSIGSVTIREADIDDIHVIGTNLNEASKIELHDNKLYINSAAIDVELFGVKLGQKINEEDIGITIEIPEGFDFESVYLNNSVGVMNVEYLEAEKIKLENGMGEMTCSYIDSPETKVCAGVGDVKLTFKNSMNDYDMRLEPGIGSIKIDGVKQNEINHTNRDAGNTIHIESGAGEVVVEFEE